MSWGWVYSTAKHFSDMHVNLISHKSKTQHIGSLPNWQNAMTLVQMCVAMHFLSKDVLNKVAFCGISSEWVFWSCLMYLLFFCPLVNSAGIGFLRSVRWHEMRSRHYICFSGVVLLMSMCTIWQALQNGCFIVCPQVRPSGVMRLLSIRTKLYMPCFAYFPMKYVQSYLCDTIVGSILSVLPVRSAQFFALPRKSYVGAFVQIEQIRPKRIPLTDTLRTKWFMAAGRQPAIWTKTTADSHGIITRIGLECALASRTGDC